jgi:hypothetical protein
MGNSTIVKLKNYSKLRMFLHTSFNNHQSVIINDKASIKLSPKQKSYVNLEYVLSILAPALKGSQNVITVTYVQHKHKDFHKTVRYTLPIDKIKSYQLDLNIMSIIDGRNYYSLSIVYNRGNASIPIFTGVSEFGYGESPISKVINDNYILGFFAPCTIKLPEPLCNSCKFQSNNSYIKCAVNPAVITSNCFECRDYELEPAKIKQTKDYY